MAYVTILADRIREYLVEISNSEIEEKKMFQGLTFMVDGKMCIGVRNNEIICRIDPEIFDSVVERIACRPMIHGKRTMKGYVFVSEEGYKRKEDFEFWLNLCLDFNKRAKSSKK
jgi:hypothetical protein